MRRQVATFITLVFLTTLINDANAAVKPGNSCKKLGQTIISSGKKYTCIKSGKKFVWDKGELVFKSNPYSPTPNNSPSKSQVPAKTPPTETSPILFGETCKTRYMTTIINGANAMCTLLNGKLNWQIDTFKIFLNIWNDVQTNLKNKPVPNPAFDSILSNSVNTDVAKFVLDSMNYASRFWQEIFLPVKPIPVIFLTELDRKWFETQMTNIGISRECVEQQISQFDKEIANNGSNANAAGFSGCGGVYWYDFYLGTNFEKAGKDHLTNLKKTGAHEYTHSAQFKLIPDQDFDFAPCWLIEGGADFYGFIIAANSEAQLKEFRVFQIYTRYQYPFENLTKEPNIGWEAFLESKGDHYDSSTCGPDGTYPVGSVANEYLYNIKGQLGLEAFMRDIAINHDYKEAINRVYGITWEQMKKEMASYIRLVVAQSPKY